MATPPAGYLKADGAAVGRQTYAELFAAIGTSFGEGDGSATFNLPDLMDRFAQGSTTPGIKVAAGLPDITGSIGANTQWNAAYNSGAFVSIVDNPRNSPGESGYHTGFATSIYNFAASGSNPIYSKSDTVQPPSLTLLPCIKAFDAATNPGLVDVTQLAQEMAYKTNAAEAAHAAMPSDQYVDLIFSPEKSYTAPTDGYFVVAASSVQGGVILHNRTLNIISGIVVERSWGLGASVPARKGDTVSTGLFQATVSMFRFIYANGSAPK